MSICLGNHIGHPITIIYSYYMRVSWKQVGILVLIYARATGLELICCIVTYIYFLFE